MSEFVFDWQWRNQTSLPPPQKTCGSNNGTWAGAKSIYMSATNFAGVDVSSTIRQMKVGDVVRIENKADSSVWSKGVLAVPPVDYSGFFTFPISSGEGQGAPVDNQVYRVVLSTGALPKTLAYAEEVLNLSIIAAGIATRDTDPVTTLDDAVEYYNELKARL